MSRWRNPGDLMPDASVLRGLTKTFGETDAVRDLDLVVPQGG
jgi:hypothetical protein